MNENRIIFYGQVIDSNDPLNLGRIRAIAVNSVKQAFDRAQPVGRLSNTNEEWTQQDPYLVHPLLPIFVYQIPKEGEFVHIIYYDKDHIENNRFYIQGNFSNIDEITKGKFDDMVNGLGLGERNKETTETNNRGLYPTPLTIGVLGRSNSDVLLPEGGFIARANKISGFDNNGRAIFNRKYGFTMVQKYDYRKLESTFDEKSITNSLYQNLNYLIEYNVYGGLGVLDGKYSAYIEVYKISPYKKISTSAFTENNFVEVSDESKIGPIFRKDYQSENFETIINGFNQVIKNLNDNSKIGEKTVNDAFPFVFQPSKSLYEISIGDKPVNSKNAKKIIQNIYLNVTQTNRGYGLLSEKNNFGLLKNNVNVNVVNPNINNIPTTVGMTTSDFVFLLSHEADAIPGLQKINFSDFEYTGATSDEKINTVNTITPEFLWNTIYPNTNSMVRGEKLLELIELMINFMINHVHPFHNMVPVDVAKDQTSTQEILTALAEGYQTILNQKLRIN